MIVLGFENYAAPAKALAKALTVKYEVIKIHQFPDGESLVQLPTELPSRIVICQTFDFPNEKLIQLYIAIKSARESGVKEVILVAPYLCYMRQDKAFKPGQAISQRIIGSLLSELVDHIITVDPHLHRINSLEKVIHAKSTITLTASRQIGTYLNEHYKNAVLIGPDEESLQWVSSIAEIGHYDFIIANKKRLSDTKVEIQLPNYDLQGKTAILVDDVISSGHTMAETAHTLYKRGSSLIIAICTHALLAPGSEALLKNSHISEVVITDCITHNTNRIFMASQLAEAVKNIE